MREEPTNKLDGDMEQERKAPKSDLKRSIERTAGLLTQTNQAIIKFQRKAPSIINNAYSDMWLTVKWFFTDFCVQVATAALGPLKDAFDAIGLIPKIIVTIISVIGLLIALNKKRWYI